MKYVGLLSGQGSQFVGMLSSAMQVLPAPVQHICEMANHYLGYDIFNICQNGPIGELNKTTHCQPATVLSSLAAYEVFKFRFGDDVTNTLSAVAGFSVGEISALAISQAISYADAFRLVSIRSKAMQLASDIRPTKMISVIGCPVEKVQRLLDEFTLTTRADRPHAVIATYFSSDLCTVSVSKTMIEAVSQELRAVGAKRIKLLPVSGAFHSYYMQPAVEAIKEMLNLIKISEPSVPVYSNITGKPYKTASEIATSLPLQVIKPVYWSSIMNDIIINGLACIELGSGKQLSSVLSSLSPEMGKNSQIISS